MNIKIARYIQYSKSGNTIHLHMLKSIIDDKYEPGILVIGHTEEPSVCPNCDDTYSIVLTIDKAYNIVLNKHNNTSYTEEITPQHPYYALVENIKQIISEDDDTFNFWLN